MSIERPENSIDKPKSQENQGFLEGIVFEEISNPKTGKKEYRSSTPGRKIVVLESSELQPESGKPYRVRVVEDTKPEDPLSGKLIVEIVPTDDSIIETEESVSYLGVALEKAKTGGGQFVPKREQYSNFINDKEVALPLQRDVAVAFLSGEPILIDGGTSLGKTTTVRKMAAELGWEVHYANLNGATDVEDLMGRYIPNPHKSDPGEILNMFLRTAKSQAD